MIISKTPRKARFVVKDTPFSQACAYGLARAVGVIPIKVRALQQAFRFRNMVLTCSSCASVRLQRTQDHRNLVQDNTAAFESIISLLSKGECVAIFPEGLSRYHPQLAPFKNGVGEHCFSACRHARVVR